MGSFIPRTVFLGWHRDALGSLCIIPRWTYDMYQSYFVMVTFYGPIEIGAKDQLVNWQQWQRSNMFFNSYWGSSLCLSLFSDVGMCSRALRSSCRAVQVGPSGYLYSGLSRKAAFGNCQVKGSCEISRVSGAPAEGRAGSAWPEPQNPLSCKWGTQCRELDDPVAQRNNPLPRNTQRSHRHCKYQSR